MTDYPNVPKAPPLPTPPKAPVAPPPTLRSATKNGNFFMEWVDPLEKWRNYDDYGFLAGLEISHLIIVGAEGVEFTPEIVLPPTPSSLVIPELKLVSPLGKGIITTNSYSGELNNGQAIYLKDVKFPIAGSVTKDITVGSLSKAAQRRTDSIFLGVRIGDALYFRVQMGTSTGGLKFKVLDAVLASAQSITATATLNFSTTIVDTDTYTYDTVNDDVEIHANGRYTITYNVRAYLTGTVTAGSEYKAYLERNVGAGFVAVSGSYAYANLDPTYESGSVSMTRILELNAGDKIRVRAGRSEGAMDINASSDGTTLTITKMG